MVRRHSSERFQLSCGGVVYRLEGSQPVYLLLRAYKNWDFPKGLLQPGEKPIETALREISEETGLGTLRLPLGELYKETEPYGKHKIARFYLVNAPEGEVTLPSSPQLGRPEHHEFRWLHYEAARELLPPRLQTILDWAHKEIRTHVLHGLQS
ncbi:bis(5'-nucleosyl)-tetraphosphatase [Candidatus Methylacidithermus pantelleriae]|uniref:Bis(5'-nucleosyl)-tetraphosphatase [asymmetrical] n=1 Tax=Candidatus Methylacidithermus pantelleriae TaxID=2744239 RepID=A0A8J2BVY6_9BACT|nr:NUDIX domain-containing protein [Candidatus Methylacidithermus pantelleriae]CAF0703559.1 Bis(5\\'-nucleosyl)-tetraphosphatase (asymmetrical) [Candidatus Methylacidithermus pantelleriae]